MSNPNKLALSLLAKEYASLQKNPPDYISVGLHDPNKLDTWEVMITGPSDSLLEGGIYKALLVFPPNYPMQPPSLTFQTRMWHPNIYEDGRVCISILHTPGEDRFNTQESADERWRPILNAEGVLVSVLSMLTDKQPNLDSPANIDAAKEFKDHHREYKKRVRRLARKSIEDLDAE
mmetsp:Transcript_6111/g.7710  ORF Transcript_6111/g.7710 Transcript_6111/m.7710 type:complete len:176 (-) Transcript_6111:715-1242(-)|eukprot:CAMPEP_0204833514 /NCGR_PEP_ID=MMETSP1346-20131115/17044_1 /ASSEMBLY_ACC=CAM_ASM_000771 /TAXON_ID=215587 /ORGANISM="Aplanochytrium stocchinoi, Strain GSBS06" /LENGTH=175 /DNA_ID=CAMNT_0051966109 /DNA_START=75 /DNA_END=602 /DNA_ORIENTATION=-